MAIAEEQLLTAGVYTLRQASIFAEIKNVGKARRWLYGNDAGEAAVIPFYGRNEDELVSFVDLVQMMAIRDILKTTRISLDKIRRTINFANLRGVPYPFAKRHQAYALKDDIVIRLPDDTLLQATGKYTSHQLFEPIALEYMKDVGFDPEGNANVYTPMSKGNRQIVLRPNLRFGAPVVAPCNYTVESLVYAMVSEGSARSAARAMGVDEKDIMMAWRYETRLRNIAA